MPSLVPGALHISSHLIIITNLMEKKALILGYRRPVILDVVCTETNISPLIGFPEKFRASVTYSDNQLAKNAA